MQPTRRAFLQTAAAATVAAASVPGFGQDQESQPVEFPLEGKLYKTLKIGMVAEGGTLKEKFKAAREAGFDGIELNAPNLNVDEARQASRDSGLPIDGTVISTHWKICHTDPKAEIRAQALRDLQESIRKTHAAGGHTALLVAGVGSHGPEKDILPRAIENISKALPTAARYGIHIAIENVWNRFMYDHDGGRDQTATKYVDFVDGFRSPWVGMQFDIGNHWNYGSMGDWIRELGRRVVKLDVKGFSRAAKDDRKNPWRKIGEGDIDFRDVRKALTEINFMGWCAAEVGGGKMDRLKEISRNMDRAFGLKSA